MSSEQQPTGGGVAEATAAAPTVLGAEPALAYDDYPDPPGNDVPVWAPAAAEPDRSGRNRWAWSVAALLAAVAALVYASAAGVHTVITSHTPPTVTVTVPQPDRSAAFLTDLAMLGIPADDAAVAVHNAQVACIAAGQGRSTGDVVSMFADRGDVMPAAEAEVFVKTAIAHYCPDGYLGQ